MILGLLSVSCLMVTVKALHIIGTADSLSEACIYDKRIKEKEFTVDLFSQPQYNISSTAVFAWSLYEVSAGLSQDTIERRLVNTEIKHGQFWYHSLTKLSAGVYLLEVEIHTGSGDIYQTTGYFINSCYPFDVSDEACGVRSDQLINLNISLDGINLRQCSKHLSRKRRSSTLWGYYDKCDDILRHCVSSMVCHEGVCKCPNNTYFELGTCHPLVSYGGNCQDAMHCSTLKSSCVSNVCQCAEGYFSPSSNSCPIPLTAVGTCSSDVDCVGYSGSQCLDTRCACHPNTYKEEGPERCIPRIAHGDPCTSNLHCYINERQMNGVCIGSTCSCRKKRYFSTVTETCLVSRNYSQRCDLDGDCWLSDGAVCLNEKCACPSYMYYDNLVCILNVSIGFPSLTVVCAENCFDLINPQADLVLMSVCPNCQVRTKSVLWTLNQCSDFIFLECSTAVFSEYTDEKMFTHYINITAGVLQPGLYYQLQLEVMLEDRTELTAFYNLSVSPALEGSCLVEPSEGWMLLTVFAVRCQGFENLIPPSFSVQLTYQLYIVQNEYESLLRTSANPNITGLYLPQGTAAENFMLNATVVVSMNNGMSVSVPLQAKVLPLAANTSTLQQDQPTTDGDLSTLDALSKLVTSESDSHNKLNDMLTSGDTSEAVEILTTVAVSINLDCQNQALTSSASSVTPSARVIKRTQIRTSTIKTIEKLEVDNLEEVEQAVSVLNHATEVKQELSPEAQEVASDIYNNMAEDMKNMSQNASFPDVTRVAGSILLGVSRILDLTIDEPEPSPTNWSSLSTTTPKPDDQVTREEHLKKVKESASKILHTVETVSDTLLDHMLPSQDPVVIETEIMTVRVEKRLAEDLSQSELEETLMSGGKVISGSFVFPNISGRVQLPDVVGIEMSLMKKNPFVWDATAEDVRTPVLSVTVKDEEKRVIVVSNLDDPVRFTLPLKEVAQVGNYSFLTYYTYNSSSSSYPDYHPNQTNSLVVNVTAPENTENISTVIIIEPPAENISFFVYLTSDVEPSYTDTQEKGRKLSDLSLEPWIGSDSYSVNIMENQGTRLFFKQNTSVNYYLGLVLDLTDNYTREFYNISEKLRPCDDGSDSGGSCCGCVSMEIGILISHFSCKFWEVKHELWTSEGCQVSPSTDLEKLHCACSHMTVFAGGHFIVVPHFVHAIEEADLFLTMFDNPIIPSTVIVFWVLYFALLHWARQRDKEDNEQNEVLMCSGNLSTYRYSYLVCFITGWWNGAGTTATVYFYLTGEAGSSLRRCLNPSTEMGCFKTGSEDWFLLTTPRDLGKLKSVTVWHDNSGTSPKWYLTQVYVKDLQMNESWYCVCDQWLAIDVISTGKGTSRTLQAFNEEDMKQQYTTLFKLKFRRDLQEGHLWVSIFSKLPGSIFTRCQRLSCGLSLLVTEMLGNIIFYGIPTDNPEDQIGVSGYFSVSLTAILIGIEVSLIIFPINFLVIKMFTLVDAKDSLVSESVLRETDVSHLYLDSLIRTADTLRYTMVGERRSAGKEEPRIPQIIVTSETPEPKPSLSKHHSDLVESCNPKIIVTDDIRMHCNAEQGLAIPQIIVTQSSEPSLLSGPSDTENTGSYLKASLGSDQTAVSQVKIQRIISETKAKKRKEFRLPWWFMYVAWILVMTNSIVCSYYVMLYGLKYGYSKSVNWLLSFFSGFTVEVLLTQPLRVVVVAVIITIIIKRSVKFVENCPDKPLDEDEAFVSGISQEPLFRERVPIPLSRRQLALLRRKQVLAWFSNLTLHSAIFYPSFLILILIITYGSQNINQAYHATRGIQELFTTSGDQWDDTSFHKVGSVKEFYQYMRSKVAPMMSAMSQNQEQATRTANHVLLKPYRVRQLRVTQDSCLDDFETIVRKFHTLPPCAGEYFITEEDTGHYNHSWSLQADPSRTKEPDHWTYKTSAELNLMAISGRLRTYSGGGFVLTLPVNLEDQLSLYKQLEQEQWIDHRTRAVFVECTLYNPNVNLYSVVQLLFEFSTVGKIFPYDHILTAKLRGHSSVFEDLLTLFQILFFVSSVYYISFEIRRFVKMGKNMYLKDKWNIVEVCNIILSISVSVLYLQQWIAVSDTVNSYMASNDDTFVSFYSAMTWTFTLEYSMIMLSVLISIRLIKFLQFNWTTYVIMDAVSYSSGTLTGFFFMVFIFTMAFGHFAHLVFGRHLVNYRSTWNSLIALFTFAIGVSEFHALTYVNLVLGSIYFMVFIVAAKWCFLTVFVAIIRFARTASKNKHITEQDHFASVQQVLDRVKWLITRNLSVAIQRRKHFQ